MTGQMLSFTLSGVLLSLLVLDANAKTGGFVQSSFFTTDGTGASESSVIGPDGIKKGNCDYMNTEGGSVSVKYLESPEGKIIDGEVTGGESSLSVQDALVKCRQQIGQLQDNFNHTFEETQEHLDKFEQSFQQQMEDFNRQQEQFAEQQKNFFKQMNDFSKNIVNQQWFRGFIPRPFFFNPFDY